MDCFTVHGFRDRAARMRELVDVWFDDEALAVPRHKLETALIDLQLAVERIEETVPAALALPHKFTAPGPAEGGVA